MPRPITISNRLPSTCSGSTRNLQQKSNDVSALNEKLDRVAKRYDEIAALLASEGPKDAQSFAKLSKEYSDLSPVVEAIRELRSAERESSDLRQMLADPSADAE